MEKSTKKKLGIFLGIALVCLLLVTYAVSTIDTARIVKVVAGQVKASTGRELAINGAVSIKVFPRLAVVANDVSLSNTAWASDPAMLKAKQVAFSLEWLPLFSKRIQIDNVTISQLQLFLQSAPIAQKVSGNWIIAASADANESASSSDFGLDLSEVHLNQLAVSYKNSAGQLMDSVTADHLDVVRSGAKVKIDSRFNWAGLPLSVNGETDSLESLINNWGMKPNRFALDLNLGINKQLAKIQGHIQFSPNESPVFDLKINSAALDLKTITATLAQGDQSGVAPKTISSNRVFSSQPLPFNTFPAWQGQVKANVGTLIMPDGIKLESLDGVITATADDSLILQPLTFRVGSGQVVADGRLNAVHSAIPVLHARGLATGFDFGHVMAQLGKGNLVSGGPTQAAFNVKTQGSSLAALAANANGALQFSVGSATVNNSIVSLGGDFLLTLANAVNPLRKSNDTSELTCLVAYLPVNNGLVKINQGVGMRTQNLDLTLDGQVNLGTEALNINFQPKERSGLTTGVSAAGLVQVTGTLANPRMGINKSGVVKQAVGVGLAIVTGGISLAAQNAAGVVTRSSPCDNVLHPWHVVAGGLRATP
ncbi:MAG: hypothetical protein RL651_1236 [Pseudomonadota bacterium]|jgi:uncharacterized protein involved in outer membrane biogenesis